VVSIFNSSFDSSLHPICLVAHIVRVIYYFKIATEDNSEIVVFSNSVERLTIHGIIIMSVVRSSVHSFTFVHLEGRLAIFCLPTQGIKILLELLYMSIVITLRKISVSSANLRIVLGKHR